MSFDHIYRFHDATLFGASENEVTLPVTNLIEMKKFLDNYKKEIAFKKKEGAIDESYTNPLTSLLYCLIIN